MSIEILEISVNVEESFDIEFDWVKSIGEIFRKIFSK